MVFTISGFFLAKNNKIKFLLASMTSLTNRENLFSNPLQEASGIPIACDPENCFQKLAIALNVHCKTEKINQRKTRKP